MPSALTKWSRKSKNEVLISCASSGMAVLYPNIVPKEASKSSHTQNFELFSAKEQLQSYFSCYQTLKSWIGESQPKPNDEPGAWLQGTIPTRSNKGVEAIIKRWARGFHQEKDYSQLQASFAKRLATEPLSALDLGREVLQEFQEYAKLIISARKIRLISISIKEWASIEEPDWQQLIIEFIVQTKPEIGLALWDNLSDELSSFVNTRFHNQSPQIRDSLSLTVRW